MANTSTISFANTNNNNLDSLPFILDASYKGDKFTTQVANILGLPDVHGWEIIDRNEEEGLALVHYKDDADMNKYGHLRGVLVDTEVGAIIADSFGYTPTAVTKELVNKDGVVSVADQDGVNHTFSAENVVIKRVFEGVVIRVIWHKGQMLKISHRKINPHRSRWGSAKSFLIMYEEAGGPAAEQLFDTTKQFSNTCYDFLVVDSTLLVGTRQRVQAPYLVLLDKRTLDIKRPEDQVAPGIASFTSVDTIDGFVEKSFIHEPKSLSLEEANHHLSFGYYNEFKADDKRLLTGEAVIMYEMRDGVINDIIKVHSPSYEWRVNMRGNNPNIVNQFYALLNSVYPDIGGNESAWNALINKYVIFPLYDEQSLIEFYNKSHMILALPVSEVAKVEDYLNRDERIHLLWLNYVISLPACKQGDALKILSQFKQDRNNVIAWLQNIEANNKDIESLDIPKRAKGLISSARRLANDRIQKGNNYSSGGSYMRRPILIKSTLRNLINKENGTSLYSLVRAMKQANNPTVNNNNNN